MEGFMKGDVVITPFPFSDLTSAVKRPALVVATIKGNNVILCQITTKQRTDPYKTNLIREDFKIGGLRVNSFIMPSILFILRDSIILYKLGSLHKQKIEEVENKIIDIFRK